MFSIIIPTWNNLSYLKCCIESINKNSSYNHQIVVHVNENKDDTINYLKEKSIEYTYTPYNSGICEGVNMASKKSMFEYILYSHDDFYFCPNWDIELEKEIKSFKDNKFYLSSTMIGYEGPNSLDCGDKISNFNEKKLINNFKQIQFKDFQGSTWAPHVIHKEYWEKVNGFSEEFFPGTGSDPDLNKKLWDVGIRIFKGSSKSRVYHFGSKTLRKDKSVIGSRGSKLFHLKWGISINFFKKFYLRSNTLYYGALTEPNKNIIFTLNYIIERIKYFYIKYVYNYNNKLKF